MAVSIKEQRKRLRQMVQISDQLVSIRGYDCCDMAVPDMYYEAIVEGYHKLCDVVEAYTEVSAHPILFDIWVPFEKLAMHVRKATFLRARALNEGDDGFDESTGCHYDVGDNLIEFFVNTQKLSEASGSEIYRLSRIEHGNNQG